MDLKSDEKFMHRALLLAKNGEGRVSPNPMVGAVIVHGGRIIGEGYHAFYGGPHAEVNAVNSVKDEDVHLLPDSTMYVTLEPCAHYGKTPPCARLLVEKGIPNVVIGSLDPNPKVASKGVEILEKAGINVKKGVLKEECLALNRRFITAHTSDMPWVILKWAQSADGYMAAFDAEGNPTSVGLSNPISKVWMHRERANVDAIIVGSNTQKIDNPQLNVRLWGGNSPAKLVAHEIRDLKQFLRDLRKDGVTSLMVEGGSKLLESFINAGCYDEIRVEISDFSISDGIKAPMLPANLILTDSYICDRNLIQKFKVKKL